MWRQILWTLTLFSSARIESWSYYRITIGCTYINGDVLPSLPSPSLSSHLPTLLHHSNSSPPWYKQTTLHFSHHLAFIFLSILSILFILSIFVLVPYEPSLFFSSRQMHRAAISAISTPGAICTPYVCWSKKMSLPLSSLRSMRATTRSVEHGKRESK